MQLKPWREVITPHPDVTSGRYRQAEFAADMSQVLRGEASPEYQDPQEFFSRTYVTAGIRELTTEVLQRLSGETAESVVKLETAFGGGKTHTMLALYHLLKSGADAGKLPGVAGLLAEAGIEQVPEANVAVVVGTALSASHPHQDMAGKGIEVRTLWGEIAAQLGGQETYEFVAADDASSTAPDSSTLSAMFDQAAPCLILIDELVAFVRNLYEPKADIVAGSFDANMTFIQSLTEAVRNSPGVMLVATIPESNIEKGGPVGHKVVAHVEHIFGRMDFVWRAANAVEGFEIVRRRLFGEVKDEESMEETCRALYALYCENPSDFPPETQTTEYLHRLRRAYPIHPEVFDRLYEDWGALERFQRTRGVLRLMAAVIHNLWSSNDKASVIMPGGIPLDAEPVRNEFIRHLSSAWASVVDSDVDGENSDPWRIDQQNARLGAEGATRRTARTIFLGSAPTVQEQKVRGIDAIRVSLGVAEPGDQLALFSDALNRMQNQLTHLYWASGRYWYDDQPNLLRTMEERVARVTKDDVLAELEDRLKRDRSRGDFAGVHICVPSGDIPDEQSARLVVIDPDSTHRRGKTDTTALEAAKDILENRGNIPRQFRNTLVFVAADEDVRNSIDEVKRYLAWRSIANDHEALNLDAHQRRQAADNVKRSDETVNVRLQEAYQWLIVPVQEGTGPVELEVTRIPGSESLVSRASKKVISSEQLITQWSPALLNMELDRWLWKDQPHINTKQLWDYLTSYCYLPRLKNQAVLLGTIREGVHSKDWFGYASGVDEDGKYGGLVFGGGFASLRIDESSLLVKPEVAKDQSEAVETEGPTIVDGEPSGDEQGVLEIGEETEVDSGQKAPTRFYGTVRLDNARVGGDAARMAEEVIQHLVGLQGCQLAIALEIDATVPDGIPDDVVRTVTENTRVLGFDQTGFESD